MSRFGLSILGSVVLASSLFANSHASQGGALESSQYISMANVHGGSSGYGPGDLSTLKDEAAVIPNPVIVAEDRQIIVLEALGMGVTPSKKVSKAQALAMAKRAAIIDGYRQLGEKMHGIRIDGRDTVRDMMLVDSTIKARLLSIVKNANVVETTFEDGLCQVKMELALDSRRWYGLLTGRNF